MKAFSQNPVDPVAYTRPPPRCSSSQRADVYSERVVGSAGFKSMRARQPFQTRARCLRDRAEYNRRRTCAPFRCISRRLPVRITTIATPAIRRSRSPHRQLGDHSLASLHLLRLRSTSSRPRSIACRRGLRPLLGFASHGSLIPSVRWPGPARLHVRRPPQAVPHKRKI